MVSLSIYTIMAAAILNVRVSEVEWSGVDLTDLAWELLHAGSIADFSGH